MTTLSTFGVVSWTDSILGRSNIGYPKDSTDGILRFVSQ